jgi:hypothetical protein
LKSRMTVKAFSAVIFSELRYIYTPNVAVRMRGVAHLITKVGKYFVDLGFSEDIAVISFWLCRVS